MALIWELGFGQSLKSLQLVLIKSKEIKAINSIQFIQKISFEFINGEKNLPGHL